MIAAESLFEVEIGPSELVFGGFSLAWGPLRSSRAARLGVDSPSLVNGAPAVLSVPADAATYVSHIEVSKGLTG